MTRRPHDAYLTEDALAQAICERLATLIPPPQTVLEPSAGEGAFCRAVAQVWPQANLHAVEPRPLAAARITNGHIAIDTLEQFSVVEGKPEGALARLPRYDLAIGNPPYTVAEQHLALVRGYSTRVAFLLRMAFLGSQRRVRDLWSKPGLRWLIPLAQRPSFTATGTDNSEYGVFVWEAGYQAAPSILPHLWVP